MTKVFKITGRTLGILMEWILMLLILMAFAIRTAPVQTFLAQQAMDYLSKELKTTVKIDYVSILFFNEAAIDGLLILDQNKDTIIYAERLYTKFDRLRFAKQSYKLKSVELINANIHIQRDTTGLYNFEFIREYFASDEKPTGNAPLISLKSVSLKNSRFRYDDNRKIRRTSGVDYNHLSGRNINCEIKNLNIQGRLIDAEITNLSLDEQSGFHLSNLSTKASISSKGALLSKLEIRTKSTQIYASKFNMLSDSYDCFNYFEDSVSFDAKIDRSIIDLRDVAYFAYALEGMNDTVRLSTSVHNKIPDLKLEKLYLRYKDKTKIKGTFHLPDFRKFDSEFFQEKVSYAYVDLAELELLTLPNKSAEKHIKFNDRIRRLGYFQTTDIRLDGFSEQFVLAADKINTGLGSIELTNGLMFTENKANKSYLFSHSEAAEYDILISELQLGRLIGNNDIGYVDGSFSFSGEAFSTDKIVFTELSGDVKRFEYLKYPYTNISVTEGTYIDQVFKGKVDVEDDYLNLVYDGYIDFKGKQHMVFTIDLTDAFLDNINLARRDSRLRSHFTVNIIGKTANDMEGRVVLDGMVYNADGKDIHIPKLEMVVQRGEHSDHFEIISDIASGTLDGKVDFSRLIDDFKYQFGKIFPSLAENQKLNIKNTHLDNFSYDIVLKNTDEIFYLFFPDLQIAQGTTLKGNYFGKTSNFNMTLNSSQLTYKEVKFNNLLINQIVDSNSIMGIYHTDRIDYNDSIHFDDVFFKTNGGYDRLTHELTWEGNTATPSYISWHSTVHDWNNYDFFLEPSYFYIKDHRWDIAHESRLKIVGDTIEVDYFELTRGKQLLLIDGRISQNRSDHLNFKISNFEIAEIAGLISSDYNMEGELNGWGYLSDPFNNIEYIGDAALMGFKVNDRLVGDVFLQSEWDHGAESISAQGDLIFKGNQTFGFNGHYFLNRPENSLDFDLTFDYTDIQFVNAFLDPDVMSDVRGILIGSVDLTGTPTSPELKGSVNLAGGSTYIDMLGVHFGVDGPIEVDEYGFFIDNIPVFDQEGNAGYLIGSIYHENFRDFNFDLQFDLERDALNKDPIYPWKVVPLKKFLLMDAAYSRDDLYYGKAYGTGDVNIFGYPENLEITVDVTTQKGTEINIPMYGVGELDEQNDFVFFQDSISLSRAQDVPKFDFTGVKLDLNFHLTTDADLQIIFNEEIGDEINANGYGDISIRLDNFGDVRMDGLFTIDHGIYNFAMGPVRQKFFIEKGGTINWTGDPYDANLNLSTYYKVNANIADISQDILASGSGAHQPVLCYLNLSESLLKPTIEFDIKAPQANDVARSLITRVTSDKDELNRQFFSLLLWKKFQPLAGTAAADGSAAAELITNQINSVLSMVSSEYKLNVAYDSDQLSGEKQYEFGVSKGFLDDRLILSGSFGVENYSGEETESHSEVIGDVSLEYLLNETGTFRVNIFNESTDKTVIQQSDLGRFTQGAGVTYKEDFNSVKDFKLIQYFLDIFRKKQNKRYPRKRNKEMRPVPALTPETRYYFRRPEDVFKA